MQGKGLKILTFCLFCLPRRQHQPCLRETSDERPRVCLQLSFVSSSLTTTPERWLKDNAENGRTFTVN